MKLSFNKIFIPEENISAAGENLPHASESFAYANALAMELLNFGFIIPNEAVIRISRLMPSAAKEVCEFLSKEFTVKDLNPPLFKNWESRKVFSFEERVLQIFGYIFEFSGNDFLERDFFKKLIENKGVDFDKFVLLKLVSNAEFEKFINDLIISKGRLDPKVVESLNKIFKICTNFNFKIGKKIESAEVRVNLMNFLYRGGKTSFEEILRTIAKQPIDALRFFAFLQNPKDFILPANVKYKNLKWQERITVASWLNSFNFEYLCEAMMNNQNAWKRFFRHIHFPSQKSLYNNYVNLYAAFCATSGTSRGLIKNTLVKSNLDFASKGGYVEPLNDKYVYRSFASRIKRAISTKNFDFLKPLIIQNPVYTFRNFNTVLNGVGAKDYNAFVELIESQIENCPVNILFSLLQIDVQAKYRIIDIKGDTIIEEANYPIIVSTIQEKIRLFLKKKYGVNGKITCDKEIADNVPAFLCANSSVVRGTKIKINDKLNYLYIYAHWIQSSLRTDLDLSVIFSSSENFTEANTQAVAFYDQVNPFIKHSGDITSAPGPKGATEYIKIDLSNIDPKVKYLIPALNTYAGSKFSDLEKAEIGFFLSSSPEFKINSETLTKIDLLEFEGKFNVPFLVNCVKKEVQIINFNKREGGGGYIAIDYLDTINRLKDAAETKKYLTVADFCDILSKETGQEICNISKNNVETIMNFFTLKNENSI